MNRFLLLILSAALLSACASTPAPAQDTGVEGQVVLGPMCPVVRPDQPCPDRPYQATLTIYSQEGRKVARFTTDADGRFRQVLAPGSYRLHPETPEGVPYPTGSDQEFSVTAGGFTQLLVQYDSGIR